MICNACNGIVGRDCFNPQECEQIAMSQMQEEMDHNNALQHIKSCEKCQAELGLQGCG